MWTFEVLVGVEVNWVARVGLDEAGRILGVSSETVRRRLKKGDLVGEKVKTDHGYQWFVELEDLAPKDAPTAVVDVVELNKAISPADLAALIEAVQAPLVNQLTQQAQLISELTAKVSELADNLESQEAPAKVGFWSRIFGKNG